jgi:hypothetical protein
MVLKRAKQEMVVEERMEDVLRKEKGFLVLYLLSASM